MSVNGQDGTVAKPTLIGRGAKFLTFVNGWQNVPAGTTIALVGGQTNISTFAESVYVQVAGDPYFVPTSIDDFGGEWSLDKAIMDSAGLGTMIPAGADATIDQLAQGQGQWTNPATGVSFPGQGGLSAWITTTLSAMTDLQIEQAVQVQWGGTFAAQLKAFLRLTLSQMTFAPYVPTQPPSEVQQYPPAAHAITNMLATEIAQSMQLHLSIDADGGPAVSLDPPPA